MIASSNRKRVLLAELEDRMAISLLARLYEHNRSHDVLLSRTADVTRTLVGSEPIAVVVTRAHPSKPGDIAQLRDHFADASNTRVIALVEAQVGIADASLYAFGADAVFQTNTPITKLAEDIMRVSRRETLLEGHLEQLGAPELIQILCLCRRSLTVRIESSAGRAMLWMQNGEIHHAVCDSLSGQPAMSSIVRADNGHFWAVLGEHVPTRSIHQDWQHVLLEAARQGDEARESTLRRQAPEAHEPEPSPHQSQVRKLGKTYRELTDLGLNSIKAGDFSKAREYWDAARAIGPEGGEPEPAGLAKTSPSAGR